MTQHNEETLSAVGHPDRKDSDDAFLDILGGVSVSFTQPTPYKPKQKNKNSLFSAKRAAEYKVAHEQGIDIPTDRLANLSQLAIKPLNSFATQPSRFDSNSLAAPKLAEMQNSVPKLSNQESQIQIVESETEAEKGLVSKTLDQGTEEEEKNLEDQLDLLDQEEVIDKRFPRTIGFGSLPDIHSQQNFKDQLKDIELNQDLNNIQAFAPYRNKHLADHQAQIELYINKAITRDRRHIGALIGAGVLGVVGFFVLSSLTVVGGIAGGVVAGVGIGRMAGRCLKRKLNLDKLDVGSVVQIRLTAMLRWAKANRKKLSIEKFSSILEKLIFEAKQCQQVNNAKPKKVKSALKAVRKFLLNRRSQIALLYYSGNFEKELNLQSESSGEKNFQRFVYQVFYIIIPLIRILDLENTQHHRDLQVYRRCVTLLEDEDLVQILHEFIQKENLNIIQNTDQVSPFPQLSYHKSIMSVNTPQRYSKPEKQEEVQKNQIKKMLTVAVLEPALITPMERRLNHQILEEATKIEQKRISLRRRNSDPAQIVNIQQANDIRMKKKIEEMNELRRFLLQNSPVLNPNSIKIEIDTHRSIKKNLASILKFDAIQATKPLHGDIYDQPIPTEYDEQEEEEDQKADEKETPLEEEKVQNIKTEESEQSVESFKSPETNPDVPECFHKLYKIAKEEGDVWHKVLQDQIIVVYRKKIKNEKCVLVKSHSILRGIDLDIAVKAILDIDFRFSWDKLFDVLKSIDNQDDNRESVLYYKIATPLGISPRDFVQRRTLRKDFPNKGSLTLHFQSIEDPRFPPIKRVVRGQTHIAGYIFEKIEPGTQEYADYMHECVGEGSTLPCSRLTIVSQNDIKGLIPKWIVNKFASKAPRQWVKTFISACSKLSGRPVIDPPKKKKK